MRFNRAGVADLSRGPSRWHITQGKQSTSKPTTADWAALRMATRDAKMDPTYYASHIARHDAGFK